MRVCGGRASRATAADTNTQGGTFLLWGLFDFVIAFYAWFGLDETRGKSLEQITHAGSIGPAKTPSEDEAYGSAASAAEADQVRQTKHADRKAPTVGVR